MYEYAWNNTHSKASNGNIFGDKLLNKYEKWDDDIFLKVGDWL